MVVGGRKSMDSSLAAPVTTAVLFFLLRKSELCTLRSSLICSMATSFLSTWDARLSWSSLSFLGRRFVPWWTWFHCTIFQSLSPRWTWFCLNKPCYYSLLLKLKKECHTIERRDEASKGRVLTKRLIQLRPIDRVRDRTKTNRGRRAYLFI